MAFEERTGPWQIAPRPDRGVWPMSAAQRRIWSLSRLRPDDPVYNIQRAWRLQGALDPSVLEASIGELLQRHETLRARFMDDAGATVQTVMPDGDFELPAEVADGKDPFVYAQGVANAEAEQAFDLAAAPPIRARLLMLGPDDHVLVLTAHHIVCDGWSMDILENELGVVYADLLRGMPSSLEPLTLQYADFAEWQAEQRDGPAGQRDLDYWAGRLEGLEAPLAIPGRRGDHARETRRGGHLEFTFDNELSSAIKKLSTDNRITPFITLLTGLQLALHQATGQDDIVICSPTAGRTHLETEKLVGYFNNLVVLRADLSADATVRRLLEQNLLGVVEALDHQAAEFRDVAVLPGVATVPLARGFFSLQEAAQEPLQFPDVTVTPLVIEADSADFELAIFIHDVGGQYRSVVRFQSNLLPDEEVTALMTRIESVLEDMVKGPDRLRSDLVPVDGSASGAPAPVAAGPGLSDGEARPRTLLESQLAEIWESVFKRGPLSIHDDFFDLGGHSLLAAELIAEVERRIVHEPMPLATLFRAPTITEFADVIEAGGWFEEWASLVPIQPHGTRPPLFFVHAHGGNVIGYRDLAKRLGEDQPFYGLQAPEMARDRDEIVPRRFEEMAAQYVEAIKTVQRHGPYLLGGWCLGADVAFEMAHQLKTVGEDVAMLLMVDNPRPEFMAPESRAPVPVRLWNRVRTRLSMEWSNLVEVQWARKPGFLIERISRLVQHVLVALEVMVAKWVNIPHSQAYRHKQLEAAHEKAYEAYHPQPYSGAVTLVRAEQQPFGRAADSALGWDRYVEGEVDVIEAPGHRVGLLSEPRVEVVAEQIRRAMEKALSVTDRAES